MNPVDILRALINERFNKSQAAFARAIKRSPSQVNQWLSGHRKLDDKGCRHIERELGLPADFMIGNPHYAPERPTIFTAKEQNQHHTNPLAQTVCELAEKLDDKGLAEAITYLEFLAAKHPANKAKLA